MSVAHVFGHNPRIARMREDIILLVGDAGGKSVSVESRYFHDPLRKSASLPRRIKSICGLAGSIDSHGRLGADAKACTLNIFRRFADTKAALRDDGFTVLDKSIGTAPFRQAIDGPDFAYEIERKTGIKIDILDGEHEAITAARGVAAYHPDITGVVADTGGGSTELCLLIDGEPTIAHSMEFGMEKLARTDSPERLIQEHLSTIPEEFYGYDLVFTGGANRALQKAWGKEAGVKLGVKGAPLLRPADEFTRFTRGLRKKDAAFLQNDLNMEPSRIAQIECSSLLQKMLRKQLDAPNVAINVATVRDGVRAEMIEEYYAHSLKRDSHIKIAEALRPAA